MSPEERVKAVADVSEEAWNKAKSWCEALKPDNDPMHVGIEGVEAFREMAIAAQTYLEKGSNYE